jgi:hypothetical protein
MHILPILHHPNFNMDKKMNILQLILMIKFFFCKGKGPKKITLNKYMHLIMFVLDDNKHMVRLL